MRPVNPFADDGLPQQLEDDAKHELHSFHRPAVEARTCSKRGQAVSADLMRRSLERMDAPKPRSRIRWHDMVDDLARQFWYFDQYSTPISASIPQAGSYVVAWSADSPRLQ